MPVYPGGCILSKTQNQWGFVVRRRFPRGQDGGEIVIAHILPRPGLAVGQQSLTRDVLRRIDENRQQFGAMLPADIAGLEPFAFVKIPGGIDDGLPRREMIANAPVSLAVDPVPIPTRECAIVNRSTEELNLRLVNIRLGKAEMLRGRRVRVDLPANDVPQIRMSFAMVRV